MPNLTADELAEMRDAIEDLLPDTCDILSVTRTSNGEGGFTETWGTVSASVACRLDAISGTDHLSAGAIQPFTRWMLTVPYDTVINNTYRVSHGGYTYNVVGGVNTDTSWIASKRAVLERVR